MTYFLWNIFDERGIVMIIFLVLSLIVAIINICSMKKESSYLLDVPVGDLEFFERKTSVVNLLTLIFFPSIVIQIVYISIVKIINSIIE